MIHDPERLAANLRRLRREQGLSRNELAHRAHVAPLAIEAVEIQQGLQARLPRIADALGVSIEELMG